MVDFRRLVIENNRTKHLQVRYSLGATDLANDILNKYQYRRIEMETVNPYEYFVKTVHSEQVKMDIRVPFEKEQRYHDTISLKSLRTEITKRDERGYFGTKSF